MPKTQGSTIIEVPEVEKGRIIVHILGKSPLILNRMSEKARQTLLLPPSSHGRRKQHTLKHDPIAEFKASPYTFASPEAPTLIAFMATAVKRAIATAALDVAGTSKREIGRLVYVDGDYLPIYGLPYLFMAVTRSSDINRTPDIRTRAIMPEWASRVEISFVRPMLREQTVINLLSFAGVTVGLGDWRPEKGAGDYGQFQVVNPDDPAYLEVIAQGRDRQIAAMEAAQPYDPESGELLQWFAEEVKQRGFVTQEEEEEDVTTIPV
jgi:hypothetical protein